MSTFSPTIEQAVAGLMGLLVGDALGVPYEFHHPDSIPPREMIEMTPPDGFHRAHASVRPGTWSDDGALALCLLFSLLDARKFDPDNMMENFVAWRDNGFMAVDNRVFDIGIATSRALSMARSGCSPLECGGTTETSNGNGSLMRILPLVLWHKGSDKELVQIAMAQSRLTHGHMRTQVCCAIYCLWARLLMRGWYDNSEGRGADTEAAYGTALDMLVKMMADNPEALNEIKAHLYRGPMGTGTGYVVESLHSARMALYNTDNYEDCVRAAIQLGHDTDTTACIVGGIAGLVYGLEDIPERWRNDLHGMNAVEALLMALNHHLHPA